MKFFSAFVVSLLLYSDAALSGAETKSKKLIEFGWDEPDTAFLRAHIEEMRNTPFDGCVFHVDYRKADGGKGRFTWEAWGERVFTKGELADALAELKATKFGRFDRNFLRFNTTPGKLDWFDGHSAVLTNSYLAARLAHEGHCPGLLFDIEQYEGPLFDYRKQRDAKSKSWEIYAAQVRRRGREVMQSFQSGYPDLTVFLTFGYSLPWAETENGRKPLADCHYGLLAPFLDGMLEAAHGQTRLVDGCELSYGYKTTEQFVAARKAAQQGLLPIVGDAESYRKYMELGFGIWLDQDWRKHGWDVAGVSKNYFTPGTFQASVRSALNICDQYVWIYSESPHWWNESGGPSKLPEEYVEALKKARE